MTKNQRRFRKSQAETIRQALTSPQIRPVSAPSSPAKESAACEPSAPAASVQAADSVDGAATEVSGGATGGVIESRPPNAKANELYVLIVGVILPFVLGGLESTVRALAQADDRLTFFAPALASAGVALFMPLAMADASDGRFALISVKVIAIVLGFAGLVLWMALVAWAVKPLLLPDWAQWGLAQTRLFNWSGASGAALIYYSISTLCSFVRVGASQ